MFDDRPHLARSGSHQCADAYEELLREEIFAGIAASNMRGLRDIKLLHSKLESEVEFITIMSFDKLAAVHEFAGKDCDLAAVPPKARQLLARFDQRS